MKITPAHYNFWCQHKSNVSWFKPSKDSTVSIHKLIPLGHTFDDEHDINNLMNIIRSIRSRHGVERMIQALQRMEEKPGTTLNPGKRSALCHKWLKKLEDIRRTIRYNSGKIVAIPFSALKVGDEVEITTFNNKVRRGTVTEKYPLTGVTLKLDSGKEHWVSIDYCLRIEPRWTTNPGNMTGLVK